MSNSDAINTRSRFERFAHRMAFALAFAFLLALSWGARAQTSLLNVSFDPTRELYRDINAAFAADWKTKTGETVTVRASHGGSGSQARAVIDGLDADVVTLALAGDIDAIAERSQKLPKDWQKRLPNASTPFSSTIVLLVRKGNPKNIRDWDDLAREGISVVTPNPRTSGGARWNYLAAWAYGLKKFNKDEAKTREFVGQIYKNAPSLDSGARGSTVTFAQRGVGDVLIAWENDAWLASIEFGKDAFDIVTPSISIRADTPVSLVDANVDKKGTRKQAEAYLQFLFSDQAQAIGAKHYYRPLKPEAAAAEDLARFKKVELVTIDDFGGWTNAQSVHFKEGAVFDQIYKPAAR